MKKDPNVILQHMLDAIADIREYIKGKRVKIFFEDKKTQDAVIRKIAIIGEAVKQLPVSISRH